MTWFDGLWNRSWSTIWQTRSAISRRLESLKVTSSPVCKLSPPGLMKRGMDDGASCPVLIKREPGEALFLAVGSARIHAWKPPFCRNTTKKLFELKKILPAPNSSYEEWMATAPTSFNAQLAQANTSNSHKLKPAIRLLKYWNARADYVFDSYGLEKWVAGRYYYGCSSVRDYFFDCIENLSLDWNAAQWRKDKLERAKKIVANTKSYEAQALPLSAELEIKKLIP